MNHLKEIEEKLKIDNENIQNTYTARPSQNISIKEYESKNKINSTESTFSTLVKLSKLISFAAYEYIKKHKIILYLLILLWIIAFRRRLKNKLSGLLKIVKFY